MASGAQLRSSIWTQLTSYTNSARHRQASQLGRESTLCASRLATGDESKDLLTSLPPYDADEAVLHEVYRDIVAAVVYRTSKRPCKLSAVVLAAVVRRLTPIMTADAADAVCGILQPLLDSSQQMATSEGCFTAHRCAQLAVQGLMTVVLVIMYTFPALQGVCLDMGKFHRLAFMASLLVLLP